MIHRIVSLCCALSLLLLLGCQMPHQSSYLADSTMASEPPRAGVERESRPRTGTNNGAKSQAPGTADEAADKPAEGHEAYRPQIIYTADLALRADRVEAAQSKAEVVVASHRGYISESRSGWLLIRIPAEHFDQALDELAGLGEVMRKEIQAQDVTDQLVDLESRLRAAEAMRDRLLALIERAENMEHALKIEQELARVVEQIEVIEGRLRLAKQQVAYSTITLAITPTPAEQRLRPEIPVVWVREIGNVIRERNRIDVTTPRRLRDGVSIDLPEGFVRYYQEDHTTHAINADGLRIRVRRMKNFDDEGPLAFWAQLIERSLRENAGLTVTAHNDIDLYSDRKGKLIEAQTTIAGETVRYLATVSVSDRYVYVCEAWGVAEGFDRAAAELKTSMQSMRAYETLLH